MMKKILAILFLLIFTCTQVVSQARIENNEQLEGFKSIPKESIYVHFNSSLLLTGEYLYYSIYCFNNESKQLTSISKVAFVELIGKDSEIIFKHKIKLDNGRGYSDFFIPVSVPSGHYKLIGYTNWMKNGNMDAMFQSDINIINPYRTSPSTYFENNEANENALSNSALKTVLRDNSKNVDIQLATKSFGNREKVSFKLKNLLPNKNITGHYSVSVRRKSNIPKPSNLNSLSFIENMAKSGLAYYASVGTNVALPELRGELISGKVTSTNKSLSTANLKVAISIPGENPIFKIAHTNSHGEFYINIDNYYSTEDLYLQVLGENRDQYTVDILNEYPKETSSLKYYDLRINPNWKDEILKQSINNQIESAYFKYKPDTLLPFNSKKLFEFRTPEIYKLEDYTRFSTLKETVIEFVKNVSISREKNDNDVFEVQGYNFGTNTGILPLVLLDGIAIQDHWSLMGFDAYNISEIAIYRDQFVFGLQVFQGAIVITTSNGINEALIANSTLYKSSIFKPQSRKKYFSQIYTSQNKDSRIPDSRQQLLWIPELEINESVKEIVFYTSDVDGDFEIFVEGFTSEGHPISISKSISVE